MTMDVIGVCVKLPFLLLPRGFTHIYTLDFFLITIATIGSPLLCFVLAMRRTPLRLARSLAHSTALYATLAPLTVVAVAGFVVTGQATFFVTGIDRSPPRQPVDVAAGSERSQRARTPTARSCAPSSSRPVRSCWAPPHAR
jgi:hypothetical protein